MKSFFGSDRIIPLKKEGYDPFIDYVKGLCIFFVVFAHCFTLSKLDCMLYALWGVHSVPIFLLFQVYHCYKKGVDKVTFSYDLKKLSSRIIKPFLLIFLIQLLLKLFLSDNYLDVLSDVIKQGGIGPGTYYVWIYIWFFFLLPVFALIIRKIHNIKLLFIFFVLLSIAVEFTCSYFHINEMIYTLLPLRFLFLFFLGYMWAYKGVVINKITIFLSCVSIIFLLYFTYTRDILNNEPIFYTHTYWFWFHWICYFYSAYLFMYFLYKIYRLNIANFLKPLLFDMGRYSYEIYLLQMFVFTFFPLTQDLNFIGNIYITALLRILLTVCLSICPVLIYKKWKKKRVCI